MNSLLGPLGRFTAVYLDDVIIFSRTKEEHVEHLRKVLQTLQKNKLFAHPDKCSFGTSEVLFLGHVIAPERVSMEPDKVAAVREWVSGAAHEEGVAAILGLCEFLSEIYLTICRYCGAAA